MATLPPSTAVALTYADWAKRLDDNYKIATIIELLSQTNEIMTDMLVLEGNLPTGHKTTVRTGLPSATWRLLNYGVLPSKSTTAQVIDTVGNLEALAQVDKDLVALNGGTAEFRLSEARAFIESMSQTMASTLIYGSTSLNPERFTGLAPRYANLSTSTDQSGYNILDAGGTGADNTSIWIVVWGENTVHGIFPKGQITGLQHQDKGEWLVDGPSSSGKFWALVDHFKWQLGLTVRDWRYVVRICNIDLSDLTTTSAANLVNLLIRGLYRIPTLPRNVTGIDTADAPSIQANVGNRAAIYCNRVIRTYLDLQANAKTTLALQNQMDTNGVPILTFRGIPIRTVDAILNNETRVT